MTDTNTTAATAEPMKTNNEQTTIEPLPDPLEFVRRAVYSYLPAHINKRWGEGLHGLRFTDTGMARACQIFGWITGIASVPDEPDSLALKFARQAAADICKQFDWLACYGGHLVDPFVGEDPNPRRYDVKTPRYIVELGDDGGINGFSVLWLVAVHPDHQNVADRQYVAKYDERFPRGPAYRYTRSMNGGLLYHGPAAGEQWAVNLTGGGGLWSIHT